MKEITLGERKLARGDWALPYFIGEAGVNHEGDLEKAKLMIDQVASAGGDAIKFQTYKAERLASKDSPAYWDTEQEPTRTQYELFKAHDQFWTKEFEQLAAYAQDKGIDFLSTPFDFEAVDLLEPLVPAYKVASADITNTPLLRHIASKGKPVLLSTGASTISEIYRAMEVFREEGNDKICLLHCVLNYPTPATSAHLGMIWHMSQVFPDYIIGYSDHTLPEISEKILPTAWLLGAQVIEKHFTFDRSLPGNDHYHALDVQGLREILETQAFLLQCMGSFKKGYLPEEAASRMHARRSLVAVRPIKRGETIRREDIAIKRPGTGIPPELLECVLEGEALRDISEDEVLAFDALIFRSADHTDRQSSTDDLIAPDSASTPGQGRGRHP